MRSDFYYPSCGAGMIHGCRWDPEDKPLAVLQLVHGVAEHVLRYDEFASFMARHGFLVVAADHMGHGGSIGKETPTGCFAGGWHKAVADVHRLYNYTRFECPDVPYILLGHSMGSFMVRTFLEKYPKAELSAAILSGTGWMHRGILNSGIAAAALVGKRQGFDTPSKFLNDMMFGSYNRKIQSPRTPCDWLTRDSGIVDEYMSDPLCGFTITPGLARDMLMGIRYIQEPEHLEKMPKDLPVYFVAGDEDPVGNYGEGVKQAAAAFCKAGMENVSLHLYPQGRHEMLNERNRAEVCADLLGWLKKQGLYA